MSLSSEQALCDENPARSSLADHTDLIAPAARQRAMLLMDTEEEVSPFAPGCVSHAEPCHGAQQAAKDRRGAGLWGRNGPCLPSPWLVI